MKSKKISKSNHNPPVRKQSSPVLRFSPTAWAKLVFFRDYGETEISGFGISDPQDLLYIQDFQTIRQEATVASIALNDEAIADFFDAQVDVGRKPEEFFRVWVHSHPGASPQPSSTDEQTFHRVFGKADWAIMSIIAQDGKTYARLEFNTGPGGRVLIPVAVDYSLPFGPSDQQAWKDEYETNIKVASLTRGLVFDDEVLVDSTEPDLNEYSLPQDILEQLEEMSPAERRAVLDDLSARPDLWGEESEVMLYDN